MKLGQVLTDAKNSMSGKWGKFILTEVFVLLVSLLVEIVAFLVPSLVFVIVYLIMSTSGTITSLMSAYFAAVMPFFAIIYMLVAVPLSYAFLKNIYSIKKDASTKSTQFIKDTFTYFARAWKVTLWNIAQMVLYCFAIIVAVLVCAISDIFIIEILAIVLIIVAYVFVIMRALSLVLSSYIAIDNPQYSAKKSVDTSIEMMRGYRLKFIAISLICVPFLLVLTIVSSILFIFAIPICIAGLLIFMPFMQVVYITFYETIKQDKLGISQQYVSNGQPAGQAVPPAQSDGSGFSIASLVLGILSVLLCCYWPVSLPLSILAIIFGAIGMKKKSSGIAIAGFVLGIIGVVFILGILAIRILV